MLQREKGVGWPLRRPRSFPTWRSCSRCGSSSCCSWRRWAGLFLGAHGWPGMGPLAPDARDGRARRDGQLGVEPVPGAGERRRR